MTITHLSQRVSGRKSILLSGVLLLAAACGGSGTSPPPPPPPPPPTYTVGGVVTGLTGTGLVLQNNGGDDRTIASDGAFSFATGLSSGAAYSVAVATRPSTPSQACLVFNGAGNVASANVTGIRIVCGSAPGKFLYATFDNPVVILGYTIDPLTGALSQIAGSTPPSGSNAGALVASPDGQFLYTVNASTTDISAYGIDATTGALTEVAGSPFALGANAPQPVFRPDGAFLYVPRFDGLVSVFSVNQATGALTSIGTPQPVGGNPVGAVIDPSGKFLYVSSNLSTQLYGYAINAVTGELSAVPGSPYVAGRTNHLALGNAGSVLYLSRFLTNLPDDSAVLAYVIDAATGALSAVAGSPFAFGTAGGKMQLSPSEDFLFVANDTSSGTGTITSFVVDPATGAITAAPSPSVQLGTGNVTFDIDPLGQYIAGFTSAGSAPTLASVDPTTGALTGTLLPPFGYSALSGLIDRSGLFFYVFAYGSGDIHSYQVDPITFDANESPVIASGIPLHRAVIVGSQ